MGRRTIRRGPGSRQISGKDFLVADELRYIQRRAAGHDGRFVTVGGLAFFSTETGDAWILDPADHLAARVARDGDPEPVYFEETKTTFAIEWKGNYRIEATASSTLTVPPAGCPASSAAPHARSLSLGDLKISNIFG